MRTVAAAHLFLAALSCQVSGAERRRGPRDLIEDHTEAAKTVGGEPAASLLAGAQLEALAEILADRRGLTLDYYRRLLSRLEEHGTGKALPGLERLLNCDVRDKREKGLRKIIWILRHDATRAWYRVKSRNITDDEKAGLLLSVLFPGRATVLASMNAIADQEYAAHIPLRKDELFDLLSDSDITMYGDVWPSPWYVNGTSCLGGILSSTPDLYPPEALEDLLLSQRGTYGHYAYMSYVEGLQYMVQARRIEDERWVKGRIEKLRRHLPGLLEASTSWREVYHYLHYFGEVWWPGGIPSVVKTGRRIMRHFQAGDENPLGGVVWFLRGAKGAPQAEQFLRDYVTWAREMRVEHPELGNSLSTAEDILGRWGDESLHRRE